MMNQKEFFNNLALNWDTTRARDNKKLQFLVDKLGMKKQEHILDLGSGTGVLLPYLASSAESVVAVDFAEKMLEVAQKKLTQYTNITYIVADVSALPFAPESFEQITCLNFFPHVQQKEAFIEAMYKLLKADGKFTILHDISRQTVNGIHGSCKQVMEDRLLPAEMTAKLLTKYHFKILAQEENDQYYFVQGCK